MVSDDQSNRESDEQSADNGAKASPESVKEILDIVEEADKHTKNPSQRAMLVWEVLKTSPRFSELSTWDIVCFAGEGVAMFHTFHPWLEEAAVGLARLMHTIHYANWEQIVQQELDAKITNIKKDISTS